MGVVVGRCQRLTVVWGSVERGGGQRGNARENVEVVLKVYYYLASAYNMSCVCVCVCGVVAFVGLLFCCKLGCVC